MATYQVLTAMPPTVPATLSNTFDAASHTAAIATVEESLPDETGPDADVDLKHLETPEGGVQIARWTRREPEAGFKRA
jgi:hypothetical protein